MKLKRDPNCTRCRLHKTTSYVCLLGTGPIPCDVAIIGEAPGAEEEHHGRPFIGSAGKLLTEMLEDVGFDRDEIFITNAISCLPPQNKTPTKGDREQCKHWLNYQLRKVKPKFVLLLGNTPAKTILGNDVPGITQLRGKPIEEEGVIYLPTFHPAAIFHDAGKRTSLLQDLRMFRDLVAKGGIQTAVGFDPIEVTDLTIFQRMLGNLRGVVSWDIETSDLYPYHKIEEKNQHLYRESVVTALGFGTRDAQWTIPLNHYEEHPFSMEEQLFMVDEISERLSHCILAAHFGNFDKLWMREKYQVEWPVDFDTGLAHYNINENDRHNLEHLAQIYYGAFPYDIKPEIAPWKKLAPYHCKDLFFTRKLFFTLNRLLKKEPSTLFLFRNLTMPCTNFYMNAQDNGIFVDRSKMKAAEKDLRKKVRIAEKRLKPHGPKDMNWASPAQVSDLLFGKKKGQLGLKPLKLTPGGKPSASAEVLKQIDHTAVEDLLALRAANQQLGLFIEGWKPYLVGAYLHPSWKIHGTVTGRPSCEKPNLQQVDRRGQIRNLITAPPGWVLVEFDLSQIELRIAAWLANEKEMLATFLDGKDIHWRTAIREVSRVAGEEELFRKTGSKLLKRKNVRYGEAVEVIYERGVKACLKIDKSWKDIRYRAKAINFGYLYGMGSKHFREYARNDYGLLVTPKEAQESRDAFFEMYPGLYPWHNRQRQFAERNGYIKTATGRKRRLPDAQLPFDSPKRAAAQRQAINSPVQGFAGELNLMAGLQAADEFPHYDYRSVGTVHDSVLAVMRETKVGKFVPRMLQIMKSPKILETFNIRISVPIEAEASIGPWGAGVGLNEYLNGDE